jgi:hypothetical protein
MIAAALAPKGVERGRKVRTPQGSVPDNVRDGRFKAAGRQVQQRTYRLRLLICFGKSASSRGKGEKVR